MTQQSWRRARVAPDETHHLLFGRPLYKRRFLRVLSFHAPGLAAARDSRGAFHIDARGNPAYSRVFLDTAGFYEDLAAAQGKMGWRHIRPDGKNAYRALYLWCGNFQGGRAVARAKDGYCHILPNGRALSAMRFLYAGDFYERRAVARLPDGLCAHIGEDGAFAHSARYFDLDVYHKGLARARDGRGWMHIGANGAPIYNRRFAQLEPFYNGRALAKTFGGDVTTIDTTGKTIETVFRAASRAADAEEEADFDSLSADMAAYWKTFALAVATELSVAERLPVADNGLGDALAIPEENARVLMHALVELDVAKKTGGVWRLTKKGGLLRASHPRSLAPAAPAWAALAKEGAGAWADAARGAKKQDLFARVARRKEKNAVMHRMLAAYAKRDYASLARAIPPLENRSLIDAGGGDGTTAKLIAAANKRARIIVFDKPETRRFFKKNVGAHPRLRFCAGDIFLPWPQRGDAALLARVLHDWDDERAMAVLRNARAALCRKGLLFVAERVKRSPTADGLCSLHLLATGGGRERSLAEYQKMFLACGFRFVGKSALRGDIFLLIGEAQ